MILGDDHTLPILSPVTALGLPPAGPSTDSQPQAQHLPPLLKPEAPGQILSPVAIWTTHQHYGWQYRGDTSTRSQNSPTGLPSTAQWPVSLCPVSKAISPLDMSQLKPALSHSPLSAPQPLGSQWLGISV